MRVRYSREQWFQWLQEQRGSGLSVAQFCKERDLPVQSFYHWRAKRAIFIASPSDTALFVPLKIANSGYLEVEMPCGAKLRVPGDQLASVLSVLHGLGDAS